MADETHVSYLLLPESLLQPQEIFCLLVFWCPPTHKSIRTKKQERRQYQHDFESWNSEGYGITDLRNLRKLNPTLTGDLYHQTYSNRSLWLSG